MGACVTKKVESVTKDCTTCGQSKGEPAMCLGCKETFRPCREHWPLFTYCSPACAIPHRQRLNEILFTLLPSGVPKDKTL